MKFEFLYLSSLRNETDVYPTFIIKKYANATIPELYSFSRFPTCHKLFSVRSTAQREKLQKSYGRRGQMRSYSYVEQQ